MNSFVTISRCARALFPSSVNKKVARLAVKEILYQQLFGLRKNKPVRIKRGVH